MDPLEELAKKAGEISEDDSPYKLKKEGSRPVQIRESLYKEIKKRSFEKDMKMIDLIDSLLKKSLNDDNK